jgi:electron transfer flavoprotein alpha subunit
MLTLFQQVEWIKALRWGMVEELATVLGAATACSKPVSDLGWRPHGEHVGQTGKPATNLYIAIGISGRYNTSQESTPQK